MPPTPRGAARWIGVLYCLLAGACDLLTGVLLASAPATVLRWMGAPLSDAALAAGTTVYVRYVGVFVGAVGAAYLYPLALALLLPGGGDPARRLPTVIEVTALVRAAVALFVATAVAAGALAPPWLTVTAVDGVLAAVQLRMLAKGWFGRG